ncbi:MAG: hypothetical protein V1750_05155 [Acidobacteriota bacterium]
MQAFGQVWQRERATSGEILARRSEIGGLAAEGGQRFQHSAFSYQLSAFSALPFGNFENSRQSSDATLQIH